MSIKDDWDDWDSCKKGFLWNGSTCNLECNKVYKISEYLEKHLIGK